MGTSLSGLTPATTFDGLLKVGDNDPLTADLKAISTGDGTDTMLELSTTALQIGGATGMYWDNTNKRLGLNDVTPTSKIDIKNTFGASSLAQLDRMGMFVGYLSATFGLALGGASSTNSGTIQGTNNAGNAPSTLSLNPFGGNVGIVDTQATARLHIKGSGATSATTSLLVQNSAGTELFKVQDDGKVDIGSIRLANIKAINSDLRFDVGGTGTIKVVSDKVAIGGNTTPTARLQVKGSGNDATTTALLVQNSDGNTLLKADDGNNVYAINNKYQLLDSKFVSLGNNNLFGTSVGTAKVQIKGSGATSATTALLVENSAGTDLLKVEDGGNVSAASFRASQLLYNGTLLMLSNRIYNASTNNGALTFNTNNLSYNDSAIPTPIASAAFQVDSTTKGFLPPRMTTTQRDAITTPAAGLMVYNTDSNVAECWNGSTWMPMF